MKRTLLTLLPLLMLLTAKAQTADTTKKPVKTAPADVTIDSPVSNDDQNGKSDKIYTSVEQIPDFPGGLDAFSRFLSMNIHYPAAARKNHVQGRVIITMVVEKDGSVSNVKVVRGVSDDIDAEATRVIKLSPKWTPGIQNGKPVRVSYAVPISFTLTK